MVYLILGQLGGINECRFLLCFFHFFIASDEIGRQVFLSIVWLPMLQEHRPHAYWEEVNLVTALVPSDTACLASSPGRSRRTAVWISREESVDFLL